jgi:ABC-type nickel/cobalt efflux system permease component RcnA
MMLLFLALVVLAANIGVTRLVLKTPAYERSQQHAQVVVIWLIPLLGAFICFLVLRHVASADSARADVSEESSVNKYASDYTEASESHHGHSGGDHLL